MPFAVLQVANLQQVPYMCIYLMAVPLELGLDVGQGHGLPLHVGYGVFERFGAANGYYDLSLAKVDGHVVGRLADLQQRPRMTSTTTTVSFFATGFLTSLVKLARISFTWFFLRLSLLMLRFSIESADGSCRVRAS